MNGKRQSALRRSARLESQRSNTSKLLSARKTQDKYHKKWTDEDLQRLKDLNANGTSNHEIAVKLGRSESSISNKCFKLSITRKRNRICTPWTESEVQQLRHLRTGGMLYKEIGEILHRSEGAVRLKSARCYDMQITKLGRILFMCSS